MTTAPIHRSGALQRALAGAPVLDTGPQRRSPSSPAANSAGGLFASTLATAQANPVAKIHTNASPRPSPATSATETGGAIPFRDLIEAAAHKYGVDPALFAALVKSESNFNPNARSGVGAKGLTQLMDATARGLGVTDSFDPVQNLEGGARFLGGLLKQFKGNESLALAAYNAGPGAVQKYGGIPPYEETQRYVPKVLGYAAQYRRRWAD
jgi:soluble lytic murein transglycosylase-like protein